MKVMQLRKETNRRELIDFYLNIENDKKDKEIPSDYNSLDWNNANELDCWLLNNGYKRGVISGFKKWAYVKLSKDDILDLAISDSIPQFKNKGQRLRDLMDTKEFMAWKPNKDPLPIWYDSLSKGVFDEKFSIIMRPACESEKRQGTKFYIEDGTGRALCYLRSILKLNKESEMLGFIGYAPDQESIFLQKELDEEFSKENCRNYLTIELLEIACSRKLTR